VKESDRQRETEGGGGAERERATESGYVYVRMAYSYGILVWHTRVQVSVSWICAGGFFPPKKDQVIKGVL